MIAGVHYTSKSSDWALALARTTEFPVRWPAYSAPSGYAFDKCSRTALFWFKPVGGSFVFLVEVGVGQVSVNLGGGYAGVTQQFPGRASDWRRSAKGEWRSCAEGYEALSSGRCWPFPRRTSKSSRPTAGLDVRRGGLQTGPAALSCFPVGVSGFGDVLLQLDNGIRVG